MERKKFSLLEVMLIFFNLRNRISTPPSFIVSSYFSCRLVVEQQFNILYGIYMYVRVRLTQLKRKEI